MWLVDDPNTRIEGQIIGFDEYMNIVLDDAEEVGTHGRQALGRVLLKGDNVVLVCNVTASM